MNAAVGLNCKSDSVGDISSSPDSRRGTRKLWKFSGISDGQFFPPGRASRNSLFFSQDLATTGIDAFSISEVWREATVKVFQPPADATLIEAKKPLVDWADPKRHGMEKASNIKAAMDDAKCVAPVEGGTFFGGGGVLRSNCLCQRRRVIMFSSYQSPAVAAREPAESHTVTECCGDMRRQPVCCK